MEKLGFNKCLKNVKLFFKYNYSIIYTWLKVNST